MHDIEQLYADHANDPRPLPLIVADLWRFPLAHLEAENTVYYAVQDWIAGLASTSTRKATRLWSDMQSQVEMSDSIVHLPYVAADRKTYQVSYTTDKGLYAIATHLRSTQARAALNAIKQYLALAGAFADDVRRNPAVAIEAGHDLYRKRGKDDQWIEARTQGIVAREHFTAALQAALGNPQPRHYALASNGVYVGLWERTAAQLRQELDLTKSASLRDHQPALALTYQRITEMVIAEKLGSADSLDWSEAEAIIRTVAQLIGGQAAATGNLLGIDLATGKRLLAS